MQLFSTNHQSPAVSLETAIFRGLPPDNGLYLPNALPTLPPAFFAQLPQLSLPDTALAVTHALLGDEIPANDIRIIVETAINFPAPLVPLEESVAVLELFHGPSMAFKDFGGRFMAGLMGYYLERSQRDIHILVATSGDTGGAVAQGFFRVPRVRVTILYPSGGVSQVQEKQLTTLGHNVTALEVAGTFDDCQQLVKAAFLDAELNQRHALSSANSINIARLIPQTFYYFHAWAQAYPLGLPVVFAVPSGNFGNLTAGLMAQRMGLPVARFVAATNANRTVPDYLATGTYAPQPSVATRSNAMDVGSPSNFARLQALFGHQVDAFRAAVVGASFDDEQTSAALRDVHAATGYVLCPHSAVAYLGLKYYLATHSAPVTGIVLATAHPAKFLPTVEAALGVPVRLPDRLAALLPLPKRAVPMTADFADFKDWLMGQ